MSNSMAVPTVTAALVTLVQAAVDTLGLAPGPVVSARNLEDAGDHSRVTVHLYRVSRNESLTNEVLPVRAGNGALRARPTVALDLHYLLCFRGDSDLDAQQMMAASAVTIEADPDVGPELLDRTEADHPEVVGNDLRDAPVRPRWCADALSVDELTKLWALYPAGSFGITLAVAAGPVLVEAGAVPTVGLPVRALALGAQPLAGLRLESVGGPGGPGAQVRSGAPMPDLDLYGVGFVARAGETVSVLLDGTEQAPTAGDDAHLVVPSTGLRPGPHRVQVRRTGPPLDPALSTTPTVTLSETRIVMVVPTLAAAAKAGDQVDTTVQPRVSRADRVRLLMDPDGGGASVAVAVRQVPAAGTTTPSFDVSDVPPGQYRLTLEVNGVRSIPAVDAAGHYTQLEVTV
jgi:hypothetical protein